MTAVNKMKEGVAEIHLECTQTSQIELFVIIVNGFQPLTIFAKVLSYTFDWVLSTPLCRSVNK